ncbi:MAG: carbon starvation protein A, partial [Bacteroidales bacterium]|nr:carbon starvation protein A [Bacteroidales bacterium]
KFGPASYLWIVLGCIFAGAVHDYLSGMLSVRNDGASLPDLIGKYLGQGTKKVMLVFTVILLILVGAVFVYSPSLILGDIAGDGSRNAIMIWAAIIFAYYLIATILPIDKIIGKIYPLFAISLIFMAIALMVGLFIKWPAIPEIWDGLANRGPELGVKGQPIFPCLFITIACGAISGFHATQSPLMARCMKNEKLGRPIFYGSMITEGLVALIWATISSYFFFAGGAEEVGSSLGAAAPTVVTAVSKGWLGVLGGILAILGVVAAPITTGDTALRSCRLIVADAVHYDQKPVRSRLALCVPIFLATALILWFNIANEDGFNVIWRYFGWANQTLSIFTLWALTVYLSRNKKGFAYMITLIPALLMTSVCTTYICTAKIGLNLPMEWNTAIGIATAAVSAVLFILWIRKDRSNK